ncbi:MAG: dTMP kinase [Deltaproteobacteria bacterium]|nr:dTMP kinase [Deltaproteobacteria bacterium]
MNAYYMSIDDTIIPAAREDIGFFIAFEGIDGSGKSTQFKLLMESLSQRGADPLGGKEPTSDNPWGLRAKEIGRSGRLSPLEELRLFTLDRSYDVTRHILPALEAGRIVVRDRYIISSLMYQGALGISRERILTVNSIFPWPDLVFILELPVSEACKRLTLRGSGLDTFEEEDFLERAAAILDFFSLPNMVRIDASRDKESLAAEILAIVLEKMA